MSNITVGDLRNIILDLPDDMEIFGAHTYEFEEDNLFPLVIAEVYTIKHSSCHQESFLRLELNCL